jgi:penicillin-binding protein 1C
MKPYHTKYRGLKITGFILLFLAIPIIYVLYFLPLPDSIIGFRTTETTKIYDRNGVLLYEVLRPEEGRRTQLAFSQFPKNLIDATLAAEDSNYYAHWGIDLWAVLRAVWLNVKHQDIVSGGSTITQQLVRNLLGTTRDRSWYNKIMESLYAIRLNQIDSKDDILEKYLNTVYYGNISYGAEAAALNYFNKHVYDLDLAEISLLAGIPKNPSLYNPLTHLDDSKERQSEVLDRMVDNKTITADDAKKAKEEPLNFMSNKQNIKAPHFVQYVLDELEKSLGKETLLYGGLKITTTVDLYLNEEIERIIQRNLENLKSKNVTNGAVMVIDNRTGDILAMVGSKDFYDTDIDGQVNVVLRKRQPGSTFKPITYAAALEKGWTPATTILDIPTKFMTEEGTPYTPKNFDLDYHGMVTVRDALANSYNIPAVKALEYAGTSNVLLLAKAFGITSLEKDADFYGLALTLGDGELTLYDLTHAFSVFANKGMLQPLSFMSNIAPAVDMDNKESPSSVIPEDIAYLITNILSDNTARVASFGAESVLDMKNIAAKTGTSRNFKDNWAIGYSPLFTVGVWVGNNDSSSMINTSGIEGAGPILHDTVNLLVKNVGSHAFERPQDIIEKMICLPSGKLPTPICPQQRKEVFIKGTEPKETDTLWSQEDGRAVLSLPPELITWAEKKGYPIKRSEEVKNYIKITNPSDLDEYQINNAVPLPYQKITFRADHSTDIKAIEWFMNGQPIGKGESLDWELQTGNFKITAKGGTTEDTVTIIVTK